MIQHSLHLEHMHVVTHASCRLLQKHAKVQRDLGTSDDLTLNILAVQRLGTHGIGSTVRVAPRRAAPSVGCIPLLRDSSGCIIHCQVVISCWSIEYRNVLQHVMGPQRVTHRNVQLPGGDSGGISGSQGSINSGLTVRRVVPI